MIIATFDFDAGWTFAGEPDTDVAVRFMHGEAGRLYPDALSYGLSALVDGVQTQTEEWPPAGATVRELSATRLFHHRVIAAPEQQVTVSVWATESGRTVTGEFAFTVPRPPRPFPSWTWREGEWRAPAPYPDDDSVIYLWDETSLSWVEGV